MTDGKGRKPTGAIQIANALHEEVKKKISFNAIAFGSKSSKKELTN
eukprot:CAMPEP_0170511208 /NCGR_PEP_ID=MMETSP0208-20121228/66175_1 /TAXON_ID=197538 /ORGANISM="Strombidium inclinatum, Strain S3" /LENGTH=45 /DNA_ID= /DNA_START= /DNA_END= /DNA_ORIENTATION=